MAHAVSSLLEAPYQLQSLNVAASKKEEGVAEAKILENLNTCLNANFWTAYDSLDQKKAGTHLVRGIELAKDLQ